MCIRDSIYSEAFISKLLFERRRLCVFPSVCLRGNGKIVFSSKIVFLSTGKIVFSKWEALADCLLCKWSTGWLSSLKTVIFTINWALYNCLLSSGKLSSEQWTIVFSKNKAVDNCPLEKMSTGKLSSEHWTIVFSKNEAVANCLPWRKTTGNHWIL